ncbi:hypothetical protein IAD21_05475 [Abditibacteriota bacterium]|nr:hypothetical protein IAD21_05475 [Abditibacteriota bacterium]
MKPRFLILLLGLLFLSVNAHAQTNPSPYNFVIGTQTIGASYGFTKESRLVESARGILKMGSDTLKFSLPTKPEEGVTPQNLTEVASLNPSVKAVLAMPFSRFIIWAYPVQEEDGGPTNKRNLDANYHEIYDLTRYLLTNFSGTNKTFYLGNWEGDWHLLHLKPEADPTEADLKAMTEWARIRQKAVDDAKRDTPHKGVAAYFYIEVNRVQDAIVGKTRLTNTVVPVVNPDFVSYSSYDSQRNNIEHDFPAALDFIQSQLKPKAGLPTKRVWIGEYGFPNANYSPQEQDRQSRRVMRAALDWGCLFVLYWEFYNNEVENGKQKGFWMINDKNEPQPVYHTHQQFLQKARAYVADFQRQTGKAPTRDEFNQQAKIWLADAPAIPLANSSPNLKDDLADFSKMQGHTDNLYPDSTNPTFFEGDSTRITRGGDNVPGSVVYACQNSKRFRLTIWVYNAPENADLPIRAFISTDMNQWREIPLAHDAPTPSAVSLQWKRIHFVPTTALPVDAHFLKIELESGTPIWTPQLSSVELRSRDADFLRE